MIIELQVGGKNIAIFENGTPPERGEVFTIDGKDYVVEGIAWTVEKLPEGMSTVFTHNIGNKAVVRCRS